MEKNVFKVTRQPAGYDLNTLRNNGFYAIESPANAPVASDGFIIVIERGWGAPSLLLVAQLFISQTANAMYVRRLTNGVWSGWTNLASGGGAMTGPEIVAAINTELGGTEWMTYDPPTGTDMVNAINLALGGTTWQGGGGGGSMTGEDIVNAITDFLGGGEWQTYPLVPLYGGDRWIPMPATSFPYTFGTNGTQPNVYASDGAGLVMGMGVNLASGDNVRGLMKDIPTGASWSAVFRIKPMVFNLNYSTAGVILRDSASGKLVQLGYTAGALTVIRWTSPTAYGDTPFITDNKLPPIMPEWYKVTRVSNTFRFYVSLDGINWLFVPARSDTDWFGVVPDQIGVGMMINHTSGSWPTAETDEGYIHFLYYYDPTVSYPIQGFTLP